MGLALVVRPTAIEVVLPTFNGARHLAEQVASIAEQSLRPVRLLLRDDGSTDGTQALIQTLRQHYGDWLQVLPSDGNLGCVGNVNRLLRATTAPYVALADQDDVWHSDKLERSLGAITGLERSIGAATPLLLHSDLALVDAEGRSLGSTYFLRQRLDPRRVAPADLGLTNVVTGCTVLCNRALLARALPLPPEALMHDWWLALVASVFGRVQLLPGVTVDYRQHNTNVLGAQGLGVAYWWRRLRSWWRQPASGGHLRSVLMQMASFECRYGQSLSGLPALMRRQRWQRLGCLLRHAVQQRPLSRKHGPLRTLGLYVLLITMPPVAE